MKFLILMLVALSSTAFAQDCNYSVTMGSFTGNVSDNEQTVNHPIVVTRPTNSSTANCTNYRIYFGKGYANNYQRKAYNGIYSLNSLPHHQPRQYPQRIWRRRKR